MIRPIFTLSILAFAFIILLPASTTQSGPASATAAADIMQCMENCIRSEGGNTDANKTTCKMRCANVPTVFGGPSGSSDGAPANKDSGSCMSAYKDCQETCDKNKKCKRVCKKALMRCQ